MTRASFIIPAIISALLTFACEPNASTPAQRTLARQPSPSATPAAAVTSPLARQVVKAAIEQTSYTRRYDPSYVRIDYPGGDVPLDRGVCSDVLVRAFRKVGIDLQKEVHQDMRRDFAAYPKKWGLARPDSNIDHRRVPNLMTFFERKGKALATSDRKEDYLPGDIVSWDLGNGLTHIGLVSDVPAGSTGVFKIVHNIGSGVQVEDVLFSWKITGHYRYF